MDEPNGKIEQNKKEKEMAEIVIGIVDGQMSFSSDEDNEDINWAEYENTTVSYNPSMKGN